jgi:short-subunit dehydrogenase
MHVFVTGASSGIGEAVAREFARAGASLSLVARRRDRLEELAASLEVPTRVIEADLAGPDAALAALAEAREALGPVEVLVNNAGVQIVGRTLDTDRDRAERLLALNVTTPLHLMTAVLPEMVERGSGSIVNISSTAALAPTPGMFHYNASKAALGAASESLRGELRGTGVHVLTVYPGPVATAMADAAFPAYGRHAGLLRRMPTGTVGPLARKIRRAVRRRRSRIVYPAIYHLTRLFPGTTQWALERFAPRPVAADER